MKVKIFFNVKFEVRLKYVELKLVSNVCRFEALKTHFGVVQFLMDTITFFVKENLKEFSEIAEKWPLFGSGNLQNGTYLRPTSRVQKFPIFAIFRLPSQKQEGGEIYILTEKTQCHEPFKGGVFFWVLK